MSNFSKTVRIGRGEHGNVFCKIEFNDSRLSISGVEGPLRNGNCRGSCGQIIMSKWNIQEYAPGWNKKLKQKFRDVWDRWHLNDMRAGCEHQRKMFDPEKKIKLHYRSVKWEDWNKLVKDLRADARAQGFFDPDPKNQDDLFKMRNFSSSANILNILLSMKLEAFSKTPIDEDRWKTIRNNLFINEREFFDKAIETTTEEKMAGWVFENEHPEGLLMKPCEVCGYRYGSAWLKEEVPLDVLSFLRDLPDADIQPAWV